MSTIKKTFDVKINSVYPHMSHSIPGKDLNRIQNTNFTKYEAQKAVQTTQKTAYSVTESIQTEKEWKESITKKYETLEEDFSRLEEKASKRLNNIIHEYDTDDPQNDALLEAEQSVFGSNSGVITYDMYIQALNLQEVINEMIQEKILENNGEIKVAA